MLDFLLYMLFSSFEYFAIIMLILSVYRFRLKYYKIEILTNVFLITFASYFLTIFKVYHVVPLPVFLMPFQIWLLTRIFKRKFMYSAIIVIAGSVFYGALQTPIVFLCIYLKVLDFNDLNNAFSEKAYIIQTLSAVIAITISIYIKIFNGGFGFTFRKDTSKYKIFLYTTIISIIISFIAFSSYLISKYLTLLPIVVVTLAGLSLLIIYLSFERDQIEYSQK